MDRRISAKVRVGRKHNPSQSPSPSPSPTQLRRRRTPIRKSTKSTAPTKTLLVLKRCKSEPILSRADEIGGEPPRLRMSPMIAEEVAMEEEEEEVLFRPQTCSDIFVSPDYVVSSSPRKCYEGSKDAKGVISVTVEGSPGPIRTMVNLSCNVEEAISVVVGKYNTEGRTPPLQLIKKDDDSASNFELHSSYFSLQSLNKSDVIGNIGSRRFYLRKRNYKEVESTTIDSDDILNDRANTCLPIFTESTFLPFLSMSWKMKFMRKTRKLWRILGCLQSSS